VAVDVRVLAATNRDLQRAVADGSFREDLYYRLAVVPIHLPPLAERREEIPHLVQHFLEQHARRLHVSVEGVDAAAMEMLLAYPWPGNIRELRNVLERALVLADGPRLTVADLPESVRFPVQGRGQGEVGDDLSVKRQTDRLERHLIQKALERTGGNRTQAAELLELSPRALRYKMIDYGLR
jgi:two-component system response regulator AtoC